MGIADGGMEWGAHGTARRPAACGFVFHVLVYHKIPRGTEVKACF